MVKVIPSKTESSSKAGIFSKINKVPGEKYRRKITKKRNFLKSKCIPKLVFHPESFFRMSWDVILLLLIVLQAYTIPYFICFNDTESFNMQTLELLINIMFCFDIVLSFNTGFYVKGSLVLKRKEIIKDYIKLWFWIDLISTIPFTYFFEGVYPNDSSTGKSSSVYNTPKVIRIIRIIRFLRILRLLRLAKLKKILIRIEDYIASNTIANFFVILRLIFMTFLAAHWIACLWFFIGYQGQAVHPITWTALAGIEDSSSYEQYITSLYWAFTTVATVGYGDITPITIDEKILAMVTMVISSGVFAYTIGSIGALLSKQTALETSYRETFIYVNSYMKQKKLNKGLQYRVRRYLDYLWEKKKKNKIDEKELLRVLSVPLRDEIHACINANVIKMCKIFEAFEATFISHLTRVLENETYAPGDAIFGEREMSYKIYFIMNGTVEIFHHSTKTSFAKLGSKAFFGEIAFFLGKSRSASANCYEFADLLSLNRTDYLFYLQKFPDAFNRSLELLQCCSEGDYSALNIRCFICDELGHVAVKCKMVIVNLDQEKAREKWLKSDNLKESVLVSKSRKPMFSRKIKEFKRKSLKRHNFINIVGSEASIENRFVNEPFLYQAIKNAGEETKNSVFNNDLEIPKLKPRYSLFYNSDIDEADANNHVITEKGSGKSNSSNNSVINEEDSLSSSEISK